MIKTAALLLMALPIIGADPLAPSGKELAGIERVAVSVQPPNAVIESAVELRLRECGLKIVNVDPKSGPQGILRIVITEQTRPKAIAGDVEFRLFREVATPDSADRYMAATWISSGMIMADGRFSRAYQEEVLSVIRKMTDVFAATYLKQNGK